MGYSLPFESFQVNPVGSAVLEEPRPAFCWTKVLPSRVKFWVRSWALPATMAAMRIATVTMTFFMVNLI